MAICIVATTPYKLAMSGHNKWSQIKNKKAKTDGQKSKIFTKYARLITVEAKKAGGNRDSANVKAVIDRARGENMPNDAIDRAVKKATEVNTGSMDAITYESYGPGGCALIIEALTDNKNKTAQEGLFSRNTGGTGLCRQCTLGVQKSWCWMGTHFNPPPLGRRRCKT